MSYRGRGRGRGRGARSGRNVELPRDQEEGKKFTNTYYGAIDARRNKLAYMYAENCRLLFNGNPFVGFQEINTFWTTKMPETVHSLKSIACNQIAAMNIMQITCSGNVDIDNEEFHFSQTFTCIREDEMWKILTDNYRYFR